MLDFLEGKQPESTQIDIGTVGWDGDDVWYQKGTDDNDGHLLVKVQLYRGRDMTQTLRPEVGQGYKILCHISSHIYRIPPRGTRVYVAFPRGMESVPGAGVIFATIEKNPTIQLEEDRVVMDYGEDTHVVIKGKSVSLQDSESPAAFIGVGTPRGGGERGIYAVNEKGCGLSAQGEKVGVFSAEDGDAKSVVELTPDGVSIVKKGTAIIKFKTGECQIFIMEPFAIKGPMILIGPSPLSTTHAGVIVDPATTATPSNTVFISP